MKDGRTQPGREADYTHILVQPWRAKHILQYRNVVTKCHLYHSGMLGIAAALRYGFSGANEVS